MINQSTAGGVRELRTSSTSRQISRMSKLCAFEQNYRSTQNILQAANQIIKGNSGRLGKNLWTDGKDGEPIKVYAGFNDIDEARFIVERIEQWLTNGGQASDVGILYRSNAQSRVIEESYSSGYSLSGLWGSTFL